MESETDKIDVAKLVDNMKADSWDEVRDSDEDLFDDPTAPALDRLESYIDHCFEVYDVVSNNLDRDQVQACIADWDRRRGQHRPNSKMTKQQFGKRVPKKHQKRSTGNSVIFLAKALVGVPPEDDAGMGWKPTVRHELAHAIDHSKRGTSDHGPYFKAVTRKFGHEENDGMSMHGYRPDMHR